MRLRGILLTVLVAILILFAALNWTTLTTPLPVDLLLLRVEVPVGAALLGVVIGLALVFFTGALFDRSAQLTEIRRLERQLEKARAELDVGRNHQIAEVREMVQSWGTSLEKRMDERVAAAETNLREALTEVDRHEAERIEALAERVTTVRNELAADVGEAEDTLKRLLSHGRDALPSESETDAPT